MVVCATFSTRVVRTSSLSDLAFVLNCLDTNGTDHRLQVNFGRQIESPAFRSSRISAIFRLRHDTFPEMISSAKGTLPRLKLLASERISTLFFSNFCLPAETRRQLIVFVLENEVFGIFYHN